MARTQVLHIVINGEPYERTVPVHRTLLDFVRSEVGLTGTKLGCDTGDCGACTVLLGGKPVASCLVLAVEAEGQHVITVEGLASGGELHPLQTAFIEEGAVQCGYCTSGMLMAAKALLDGCSAPTESEVREALAGNLCRCTGYTRIVEAVLRAAQHSRRSNEVTE